MKSISINIDQVMIPFILLCLLIARAEYHLSGGVQWDFAITGYGPRDLLIDGQPLEQLLKEAPEE